MLDYFYFIKKQRENAVLNSYLVKYVTDIFELNKKKKKIYTILILYNINLILTIGYFIFQTDLTLFS